MVTITDHREETSAYWEVVDSNKPEKISIPYDRNYLNGYYRVYVLQQLAEWYSILNNCNRMEWQKEGFVFVLS